VYDWSFRTTHKQRNSTGTFMERLILFFYAKEYINFGLLNLSLSYDYTRINMVGSSTTCFQMRDAK
jgi:hypothetical protein